VGLLPLVIREGYRLPWDARRARALALMAAASRQLLPLAPPALRYWAPARRAIRRSRRAMRRSRRSMERSRG
jgi:uncharacterized protein (DUF2236 family)